MFGGSPIGSKEKLPLLPRAAGGPSRGGTSSAGRGTRRRGTWSRSHSARTRHSSRVRYRWHPLCGCEVEELRREQHAAGEYVRVERSPDAGGLLAAWMLDPITCAQMELGELRASSRALAELHHLLIGLGFREECREDTSASREDSDDGPSIRDTLAAQAPAVAGARRWRTGEVDARRTRDQVVQQPACLLLEAPEVGRDEDPDDDI